MSDTKVLIKYVSDRMNEGPNITFGKPTVLDLLKALEQAEARAEKAESDKAALEEDLEATEKNLKEFSGFIEELLSGLKHRFPVQYADLEGDEYGDDAFSSHDLFQLVIDHAVNAAQKAEAENARLQLKCGESAPEGTEIYHVGPTEYVLCPSCNYEIEDPWDEPETDPDADGWHGVITCRNCSSKIEVHSQLTHFWTARLAEEVARRAVADAEVGE